MASMLRALRRIANSIRGRSADEDAAREIASHLELLQDEFVRRGLSAADARVEAHRALGSAALAADLHRDARSFVWLDDLRWDLGYAARLLRRNPIFTATAALSLAIGIGANTAIFTLANALLFRPPSAVAEPDRLVDIGRSVQRGNAFNPGSYPDYLDLRERTTTLDGVYASTMFPSGTSFAADADAGIERVFAMPVSVNYFAVLGVAPAAGRLFGAADSEVPSASPIAVLSHRFWARRFNADPAAVGRTVRVDGRPFTIVGVAPEGFQGTGLRASDIWIPITMSAPARGTSILTNRAASVIIMGGRLRRDVGIGAAAAEVETIGAALEREHPEENGGKGLRLLSASPVQGNREALAVFLALLTAIVSTMLVVACANLAGVLLARAAARRREIAVRLAIGAGRSRLVRQLVTETFLLVTIGGAAGLALARVTTSIAAASLPALPFPIDIDLALDARVVAFTTGLSLAAALLCGLVPALQASNTDTVAGLRDDSVSGGAKPTLRRAFLVAQIAFSLVLVVVAGLFARALQRVGSSSPGFDPSGVEVAALDLSVAGYTDATAPPVARDLLERVRRLPSVESATIASGLPSGFERFTPAAIHAPGDIDPNGRAVFSADWNILEPGYFSTMRIAVVSGRDFTAADRAGSQLVVILGAGAARKLFPDGDAVGHTVVQEQRLRPRAPQSPARPLLVVGVAADPTYGTLVDGMTGMFVYVPLQQQYRAGWTNLVVRTRADSAAHDVRAVVRSMDANVLLGTARPARDITSLGLLPQRIASSVAGGLGVVGLLLAAVGIYGVTAYAVARRIREFGVRIALGATRGDIVRLVLREGMGLTIAGSIAGLALSAGAARLVASFLFGLEPGDPATFIGAAALFAVVGLAACYLPARRATQIDAMEALRYE